MGKQISLDGWLRYRFLDLLVRGSDHVKKTKTPIILYRRTIEEEDETYEEEICSLTDSYVIVQVITLGGFVAPTIQQQHVFLLKEFPEWILQKSRDLFFQCMDQLEEWLASE